MKFDKFDIFWAEIRIYPCVGKISKHKHSFFHFLYVLEGTAHMTIGERECEMKKGNIYLVPPETYHSFSYNNKIPLKTIEIKFSLQDNDEENEVKGLPDFMDVAKTDIEGVLFSLYKERIEKVVFSNEIISLNFKLFLNYLMRCFALLKEKEKPIEIPGKHSFEIQKALEFIDNKYYEEISLDKLSNVAGFEKNYFSRKFKKETDFTPMDYLRNVRIKKAKELLLYSDLSISQIADVTGFENIHYFSNVFLKITGTRPFEYRERVSQSEFN